MVTVKNDKQLADVFKARGLTSVYDMEVSALSHAMERVGLAVGIQRKKIVVFDISDPESSFEVSLRDVITMTTERLKAETPDSQVKQWKFLLEITASKCASEDTEAEIDIPDLSEPEPEPEVDYGDDNNDNAADTEQDFDNMTDFDESDEDKSDEEDTQPEKKQSSDKFNFSYRKGHRFGNDDDGIESNANDTDEDAFGEDGDDDDEFEVDPDADQENLNGWNDLFSDSDNNDDNSNQPERAQPEQPDPQHEEPKRMSWVDRVFRKRNTQQVNDKAGKENRVEAHPKTELWPDENYVTHAKHETESRDDDLKDNELDQNFDQLSESTSDSENASDFDVGFDQETDNKQEPSEAVNVAQHDNQAAEHELRTPRGCVDRNESEPQNEDASESESEQEQENDSDSSSESEDNNSDDSSSNKPETEFAKNEPQYFKVTIVESYTKAYMVRAKNETTAIAAIQSMWNRMNKANEHGLSGTLDKKNFADLSIVAEQIESQDD